MLICGFHIGVRRLEASQLSHSVVCRRYADLMTCQYHWVSELGPPRFQKGLSYAVGTAPEHILLSRLLMLFIAGWLLAIGWQVYLAGVCFMVGGVVQGLIALNVQNYEWHSYHATLLAIAIIAFSIVFNTALAVRLPVIEGFLLIIHVAGLLAIIIPLWVMAPRGDAPQTLLVFTNNGGWSSTGLSAMIGLSSIVGLLIGYDCSVHMCKSCLPSKSLQLTKSTHLTAEEVQDASRTIPNVIVWSMVPNALMYFVMGVTFIFCLGDLNEVLDSPTGEPFIQVFFNATKSYAGTTVMTVIIIIMLTSSCISEVATASRQIRSFARDGGLPGSKWLSKVTPGWNIPLHAVCVSLVVSSLLSLINIGSSTALNAINSLGGTSILFSYFITIGCLVWRRIYGPPLPPRRWSLGKSGLPINIAALIFVTPVLFFYVWPLTQPVTAGNIYVRMQLAFTWRG